LSVRADAAATRDNSGVKRAIVGLLGIIAVAGFTALGFWQIHRLAWKLDLISAIGHRIHASAVDAPGPVAWPSIDALHDAYRRVRASGVFRGDRQTLVQAVTALGGGYWVMTPLQSDGGFTVLVNRGFVDGEHKDRAMDLSARQPAHVRVSGLLRVTEPAGGFLRANDPAEDRWYSRDVAATAKARGLEYVAPYFIDADAAPGSDDGPIGGLTVTDPPNNHLVYALTWFALAAISLGAVARVAADQLRSHRFRMRPAKGKR
jgi:surfeit locus 1 family protein